MRFVMLLAALIAPAVFGLNTTAITARQKDLLNNRFSSAVPNIVQLGTLIESGLSTDVLAIVDKQLTAAALDTANATPVVLIPAPGAGKVIMVTGIFSYVDFVATRLELGSGTLDFKYTDGSGVAVATAIPNTTVELNSDTYYVSAPLAGVAVPNAAIVASASADVTSGDSIINVRIAYRTVTVSDI